MYDIQQRNYADMTDVRATVSKNRSEDSYDAYLQSINKQRPPKAGGNLMIVIKVTLILIAIVMVILIVVLIMISYIISYMISYL